MLKIVQKTNSLILRLLQFEPLMAALILDSPEPSEPTSRLPTAADRRAPPSDVQKKHEMGTVWALGWGNKKLEPPV